jgi:adenosylcobyric acid synthase
MMGERVLDPDGVESSLAGAPGLGLLPVETVLTREKVTGEASGIAFSGEELSGYEIHCGRTIRLEGSSVFSRLTRRVSGEVVEDGCILDDGRLLGTYLHGLFDSPAFRRRWLNAAGGSLAVHAPDPFPNLVERSLNRLAETLMASTDWKTLKRIAGLA